jgi:hypothetical protein
VPVVLVPVRIPVVLVPVIAVPVVAATSATTIGAGVVASAAAVDRANRAPNAMASAVAPTALSDVAPAIRRRPAARVRAP